jgi:ATP-binding cassette, subfamily B, bacterial
VNDSRPNDTEAKVRRRAANRLLLRVAGHGAPWVGLLSLTAFALAAGETALPAVLGRAIDATLAHRAAQSWLTWLGLLVALIVLCDTLDDLAAGATIARSTAWLRRSLVRHVLALPPRAVDRFGAGEVAGRLVGNASHAGAVAPDLVRAAANLIPALGGTVALGLIDPWLFVTFLAGLPVLLLIVRRFVREASDHVEHYLRIQGRIAARLLDAISGARTIAAAGTVAREAERVLEPLPELHRHGLGTWGAQRTLSAQDALVVPLLELAVLAVAGAELARGRVSVGQFLAAGQYAALASTLGSAVGFVAQLVNVRAAATRAVEVLSERPLDYGVTHLPSGSGMVEFCGATVRSAGRVLLEPLDLTIPAGAMVAVVGPNGAGKSLLAALAGRLIDPDAGEVRLDGLALQRLSRQELRTAIGYGFASPALIGETIADAIGFGAHRPPADEIAAAALAARADEFIRRLPSGYATPLHEAPLSGGEIQRLGLARAFAHAGRVVILDDVAASLDTMTEHEIAAALTGALADSTRIVVAHRASTAARADLVVWLVAGRLRAVAAHDRLWADRDYRALFEATDFQPPPRRAVVIAAGAP